MTRRPSVKPGGGRQESQQPALFGVARRGLTARGKLRSWKRVIAGNTISLVKGLPETFENMAKEEKATAKGVNDQRKLEEAER